MKKRLLSLLCVLVLTVSVIPAASALEGEAARAADTLSTLGLIDSTYNLPAPATRAQAAVLLVHLAGAEQAAAADNWLAGFRDVPAGHWAADAISQCVTQGWFQGKSADTFGVGQPMTRAGFAVALSRFFGWQSGETYYRIFSDVPQGAWYEPALRACYEHGAVTRQTGDFRPGDPITREELAVMLIRALGYGPIAGLAEDDPLPFRDVTTNKGHIAMAYELGLVSGMGNDLFVPDRYATREQAAVMLSRLYPIIF